MSFIFQILFSMIIILVFWGQNESLAGPHTSIEETVLVSREQFTTRDVITIRKTEQGGFILKMTKTTVRSGFSRTAEVAVDFYPTRSVFDFDIIMERHTFVGFSGEGSDVKVFQVDFVETGQRGIADSIQLKADRVFKNWQLRIVSERGEKVVLTRGNQKTIFFTNDDIVLLNPVKGSDRNLYQETFRLLPKAPDEYFDKQVKYSEVTIDFSQGTIGISHDRKKLEIFDTLGRKRSRFFLKKSGFAFSDIVDNRDGTIVIEYKASTLSSNPVFSVVVDVLSGNIVAPNNPVVSSCIKSISVKK